MFSPIYDRQLNRASVIDPLPARDDLATKVFAGEAGHGPIRTSSKVFGTITDATPQVRRP
jgi:hypothetical protein